MKFFTLFAVLAIACLAQEKVAPKEDPHQAEDQALSTALSEAGNSPIEFIRVLEAHLAKYPMTARRNELERALVKAAIETKDDRRIILYGERVLAREADDVQILDRVARALLSTEDKDAASRALKYAQRYEEVVAGMRSQSPPGRVGQGQWQEDIDRGLGRALALKARATGGMGKLAEAAALAKRSWESYPTVEGAREMARWLERSGKTEEAIQALADAFAVPDPKKTDADQARDRARLGEWYSRLHGSETGLGDVILQAYDRTTALIAARKLRVRESDPNAAATKLMDFTLTGTAKDEKLPLASLQGKTVVFDFWATWCGPCRAQHPLYEEVKKRFQERSDVVFLSVNTDEDRDAVEPFLKEQHWEQKVWFEDGISRVLKINSIPTTIVVDKRGEVVSRMNGYVPQRFVDMLSERIQETLN